MMSDRQQELKLHATVSELLAYINVDQDPQKFLESISSKNQYSRQGSSAVPLAESIALKAAELSLEAPHRFLSVYERLSALSSSKELEGLMYILNKVHSDPRVAAALNSKPKIFDAAKSSTFGTPSSSRKDVTQTATGLSKSRSFAGTTLQATPAGLRKSHSNVFTPNSTRFLNSSTLAGTPFKDTIISDQETKGDTASRGPTLLFASSQILLQDQSVAVSEKIHLSSLTIRDQEALVIEDLLYVLLGVDGEFITREFSSGGKKDIIDFSIDQDLDASLADLLIRILPICSNYLKVSQFVEEHSAFEYGRVHHALCATMRDMMQEFHILIAQLEHHAHTATDFSLQKLWFYITPSIAAFENLASLVAAIEEKGGGDVFHSNAGGVLLSLLADRMTLFSGNVATKNLYAYLLAESSKPYFAMLQQWVCRGILDDPYKEFMIQERANISKDKVKDDFNDVYWEQRYSLHHHTVPSFLEPYKEKILLAGKYLNVLRECYINVEMDESVDDLTKATNMLSFSEAVKVVDGAKFIELVDSRYLKSNRILLDLLLKDIKLLDRLRSIKTFFLLGLSDYLTHFLDISSTHLCKPVSQISMSKITSLLELVVRTPSTASSSDPYKDDLLIEMSPLSLFDQLLKINSMVGIDMKKHMENIRAGKPFRIEDSLAAEESAAFVLEDSGPLKGIDAFTLGYSVTFPLSLVLNKKIMTKYQIIFRHLFKCKYLERCLGSAWLEETKALGKHSKPLSSSENNTIIQLSALRGKMLHFIQQLIYFMFFEVIDPNWNLMQASIRDAVTIEDLLQAHDDFLDTCLKECMLTNPKLIVIFSSLISTCHAFVSLSTVVTSDLKGTPRTVEDGRTLLNSGLGMFSSLEQAQAHVKTLEHSFLVQLHSLMDSVQLLGVAETARLGSLVSQLDFNSYYSSAAPLSTFILNPIVPSR